MSEENVEVVRRLFETYNQGDCDAALRLPRGRCHLAEALAAAGLPGRLPS